MGSKYGRAHGPRRGRRVHPRRITLLALAAALVTVTANACSSGPAAGVHVAPVGYATVAQVVQAPANVVPKSQVSVTAAAAGTVAVLDVQDGQRVTAGQVLGRVSSPSAQQELKEAKKAAAQASDATAGVEPTPAGFSTAMNSSRARADRAFDQAEKTAGQITDPQLRQAVLKEIQAAKSSYDGTIAAVAEVVDEFQHGLASASQVVEALGAAQSTQAEAAVTAAQDTVNSLTVKAPISGVVTLDDGQAAAGAGSLGSVSQLLAAAESSGSGSSSSGSSGLSAQALGALGSSGGSATSDTAITVGSPVSGGGTLFTLTDSSALSIQAQVDETDVLTVKPGVSANIELNAVPGATYQGTVTSVDPTANTSSQGDVTYTVHLTLGPGTLADGSAAPTPLPGMSAIANLNVLTVQHALSVPSAALMIDGNTTSVWLIENGQAQKRAVVLGAQGDTLVQVLSGLSAGEQIVVSGADQVTTGEKLG